MECKLHSALDGKLHFHSTFETQGVSDQVCVSLAKIPDVLSALSACVYKMLVARSNNQTSKQAEKKMNLVGDVMKEVRVTLCFKG